MNNPITSPSEGREPIGLVFAGEQALHSINELGICKYCGRLWEELQTCKYRCTGYQNYTFKGTKYLNAPRHPLFMDAVMTIRECQYCQGKREGFCKRHNDLRQFLE